MTTNNLYSALPQSLSDSDSEKESNDVIPGTTIINRHVQNGYIKHYHPTRPQSETSSGGGGGNASSAHRHGFKAMSRTRKCLFIGSILLCFIVIIVFLWVLPCNSSNLTCPAHITSWKIEHRGIEFTGKINIIRNEYKSSVQIALIVKKNLKDKDNQSGAMGLKTSNGEILWFIPQPTLPKQLDCEMIDINLDGIDDCLLLNDNVGLEAFNPITSEYFWHAHTKTMAISNLKFPQRLLDKNGDGVVDLLAVTGRNKFVIISGKDGGVLNDITLKNCLNIEKYYYENGLIIYSCMKANNAVDYYKTTLTHLLKDENSIRAPVNDERRYILDNRELFIENTGKCPRCSTNITLIDQRSKKTLLNWNYNNRFTMRPVSFAFQPNESNLKKFKGYIYGFIIKLWGFNNMQQQQRNNISEHIVLITFNDTIVKVINVSYVQLIQMCFENGECQPELLNGNESLLVSDLDYDGMQEIISYSTSFKCGEDEAPSSDILSTTKRPENDCALVSKIEVIRLEDELPKFYAT